MNLNHFHKWINAFEKLPASTTREEKFASLGGISGELEAYVGKISGLSSTTQSTWNDLSSVSKDIYHHFAAFKAKDKNKKSRFYADTLYNFALHLNVMCTIFCNYADECVDNKDIKLADKQLDKALQYSNQRIKLMQSALNLYTNKEDKAVTQDLLTGYQTSHQLLLSKKQANTGRKNRLLEAESETAQLTLQHVEQSADETPNNVGALISAVDALLHPQDAVHTLLELQTPRMDSTEFKMGQLFSWTETIKQIASSINNLSANNTDGSLISPELEKNIEECIVLLRDGSNKRKNEQQAVASSSSQNEEPSSQRPRANSYSPRLFALAADSRTPNLSHENNEELASSTSTISNHR